MSTSTSHASSRADAVFYRLAENTFGKPILPLYNITVVNHPSYGSTVSDKTLRKLNLRIPEIPSDELPVKETMKEN